MLYKGKKHITPRNSGRVDVVRDMSDRYEKSAQKQTHTALEAANFEITLYKIKTHGKRCTCCRDSRSDILGKDGKMGISAMDAIIDQALLKPNSASVSNAPAAIAIGMSDYAKPSDMTSAKFEELDVDDESWDDDDIDPLDQEDIDQMDNFETELNTDPTSIIDLRTGNCPICSRTGFVGGFNVVYGERQVFDNQAFFDFTEAHIITSKTPFQVEAVTEQPGSVKFVTVLPKFTSRIVGMRLLNGWKEATDWRLFHVGSTETLISNTQQVKALCTGQPVTFRLEFTGTITHFELQLRTLNQNLLVDLSPFNRSASSKRLNDLDALTFNFPPAVGTIRRGDVFYEKRSQSLWVVSQTELQGSSKNRIGFTGSAERVKSVYEPYSLLNPYKFTTGEIR